MEREKTHGIVLGMIPYNDKTSFVHIYTDHFGPVTYSIANTRSKRAKLPRSLFVPFSVLEMEVEHYPSRDIQKIAEARTASLHYNIYNDPIKNAIVLFLAEFLQKVIREHEPNIPLYHFIADSIDLLDLIDEGKGNFHLVFMFRIAEFLGFRLNKESFKEGYYFDLMDASFYQAQPSHPWFIGKEDSLIWHKAMETHFSNLTQLAINRHQRNLLLEKIIMYFKLHIPDIKEFKSLDILKMLFS